MKITEADIFCLIQNPTDSKLRECAHLIYEHFEGDLDATALWLTSELPLSHPFSGLTPLQLVRQGKVEEVITTLKILQGAKNGFSK